MKVNITEQMELGFNGNVSVRPNQPSRVSRARWWFEQMRQVVDRAIDWQPNGPGRPEQTWFAEANGSTN
jgi:hypothetical protein